MRVVCPECFASYQVEAVIKNAVLVCYRCNTEFDSYGNRVVAGNATAQIFQQQEEQAPTFGLRDLMQSGMKKRRSKFWLWMILLLISVAAAGLVRNWEQWSHHSLIRGYTMKIQPKTAVLDRDWEILPTSIHTQWLKRADNSLVLILEGQVENKVSIALPTPEIKITFITQTGQNTELIQAITEPASLDVLTTVPFMSPPVDKTPVNALGSRGFLLVIEDVPLSTQYLLLHALAVQKKGKTQL